MLIRKVFGYFQMVMDFTIYIERYCLLRDTFDFVLIAKKGFDFRSVFAESWFSIKKMPFLFFVRKILYHIRFMWKSDTKVWAENRRLQQMSSKSTVLMKNHNSIESQNSVVSLRKALIFTISSILFSQFLPKKPPTCTVTTHFQRRNVSVSHILVVSKCVYSKQLLWFRTMSRCQCAALRDFGLLFWNTIWLQRVSFPIINCLK